MTDQPTADDTELYDSLCVVHALCHMLQQQSTNGEALAVGAMSGLLCNYLQQCANRLTQGVRRKPVIGVGLRVAYARHIRKIAARKAVTENVNGAMFVAAAELVAKFIESADPLEHVAIAQGGGEPPPEPEENQEPNAAEQAEIEQQH